MQVTFINECVVSHKDHRCFYKVRKNFSFTGYNHCDVLYLKLLMIILRCKDMYKHKEDNLHCVVIPQVQDSQQPPPPILNAPTQMAWGVAMEVRSASEPSIVGNLEAAARALEMG